MGRGAQEQATGLEQRGAGHASLSASETTLPLDVGEEATAVSVGSDLKPTNADLVTAWESSEQHPRNWAQSKRWKNTLIISITGFLATTGSSIFVPAAPIIMREFNASREVVTLTTALNVLGLGCGPFLFAPISELYGRQTAYSISMIGESQIGNDGAAEDSSPRLTSSTYSGFFAFNLACCFATDLTSLIILRL